VFILVMLLSKVEEEQENLENPESLESK